MIPNTVAVSMKFLPTAHVLCNVYNNQDRECYCVFAPHKTRSKKTNVIMTNINQNENTRKPKTSAKPAEPANSTIRHCRNGTNSSKKLIFLKFLYPSRDPDCCQKSNQLLPVKHPKTSHPSKSSSKFVHNFQYSNPNLWTDERTKEKTNLLGGNNNNRKITRRSTTQRCLKFFLLASFNWCIYSSLLKTARSTLHVYIH